MPSRTVWSNGAQSSSGADCRAFLAGSAARRMRDIGATVVSCTDVPAAAPISLAPSLAPTVLLPMEPLPVIHDTLADIARDALARRTEQSALCFASGGSFDWVTGTCSRVGVTLPLVPLDGCTPPLIRDIDGECRTPGSPAEISIGGAQAVRGVFGAGFTAEIVGSRNGNAIRQCMRGFVLGTDDVCYDKGALDRRNRKWKPARRPIVSAHEARLMRTYGPKGSKRKRVKKLAQVAGFTCKN